MARYYRQVTRADIAIPRPSQGPLLGGELAAAGPIAAVMRAQDRIVTQSRRVLLQLSFGGDGFVTPSTDPINQSPDTHPHDVDAGVTLTLRALHRAQVEYTPGTILDARILCARGGYSRGDTDPGTYEVPILGGRLQIDVTWTWRDSTDVSVTRELVPQGSVRQYGGRPTGAGQQWAESVVVGTVIAPDTWLTPSQMHEFRITSTRPIVTITLSATGGVRPISGVVSELPDVTVHEADDTTWTSHCYGSPYTASSGPVLTHPMQRISETASDGDPRGGAWHMQDVATNQTLYLGPVLGSWTCWREHSQGVDDVEGTPVTSASSTWAMIANSAISEYDETLEGWSISSGAYARSRKLCDPIGMPHHGVIPVICRVYANQPFGSVGVVRFQCGRSDYVDVTLNTNTGWTYAYGHLAVGSGIEQLANLQVFLRRESGIGTISLYQWSVHYGGQWTIQ